MVCKNVMAQNIANNNIATSQTVCAGIAPNQLTGTLPTGGTGTYQFEWLESISNPNWGYTSASGLNNTQNYQPPLLSTNVWYKRVVNSGNYSDTSAPVTINYYNNNFALTASGPLTICPGDSVILLTTIGGAGQAFQWKKGGIGLSNWTNISGNNNYFISAKTSGEYLLNISLSNGCVFHSDTVTVQMNSLVNSTVTPGGTIYTCNGSSITFTGNVTQGLQYQWFLNSNPILGATDTTYTTTVSGTYKMKVTSGSCSAFSTNNAFVSAVNVNPHINAGGNTNFCQGGNTILVLSTPGMGALQWYDGNTLLVGANNTAYTATVTGSYKIKVTYLNCSAFSNVIDVIVSPPPSATIVALSDTVFCNGDSVVFQANTGPGLSYQWIKNSGNTGPATQSSTFVAYTSGVYSVLVYNLFMCSSHANNIAVSVHPQPNPIITHTLNTLSTSGFISYQWFFNGNPLLGETNPDLLVSQDGIYSVKVIDSNGCEGISASLNVTVVGINEIEKDNLISIYPNPTHNKLYLETKEQGTLFVENVLGTNVYTKTIIENKTGIDFSNLSEGIYMLRFQTYNSVKTLKVLKL